MCKNFYKTPGVEGVALLIYNPTRKPVHGPVGLSIEAFLALDSEDQNSLSAMKKVSQIHSDLAQRLKANGAVHTTLYYVNTKNASIEQMEPALRKRWQSDPYLEPFFFFDFKRNNSI